MSYLKPLLDAIGRLPPGTPVTEDQWLALSSHVPDGKSTSLSDIFNAITGPETATSRVGLLAILACLKGESKLEVDAQAAQQLCEYAAAAIAPSSQPDTGTEDPSEDTTEEDYEDTVEHVRNAAVYGLEIIYICTEDYAAQLSQNTILTLISFADPTAAPSEDSTASSVEPQLPHPWATAEASELAARVLAKQPRAIAADELITAILQDYLRPLFSKSRPSAVTATGRKAAFPEEQDASRGPRDETGEVKPWKYLDHRAIAVFRWAVQKSSETLISQQWHMFIPVLLTLLDDGATRVRSVGLLILPVFLSKFPDKILHDTGLASVFGDAVFPTLHFLPSMTPEAESVQLLGSAYNSLLVLSRKLDYKVKVGPDAHTARKRLLDRMLREGVVSGYLHAKQYVRVAQLLFDVTAGIVTEMGLHAVKHLKDLIPMHCETLADPFVTAAPGLLDAACTSIAAILSTCWPRLGQPTHQDELIKALVMCFINVHEAPESNEKLKRVKSRLRVLGRALYAIGEDSQEDQFKDKVVALVAKEPLLEELFIAPPRQ